MLTFYLHNIQTPFGPLTLGQYQEALICLCGPEEIPAFQCKLSSLSGTKIQSQEESTPLLLEAERQLKEYFAGERQTFQLPLGFYGTDFQQQVWQQLLTIPYGESLTYGDIAQRLSHKGARVVGTTVGKNPIPIIVPCHRVLPASGVIGNFSMVGGAATKRFLLDLEGVPYKK